jgi:hypothetical protein
MCNNQKEARSKARNDEQCAMLEARFANLTTWDPSRGIARDFVHYFQMANPAREQLLPIAIVLSHQLDLPLCREFKRQKRWLVGWFNENEEQIRPFLSQMVLEFNGEQRVGLGASAWEDIHADEPESLTRYRNGTSTSDP